VSVQHPALRGYVPIYWRGGSTSVSFAGLRFDQQGYFDVGDPSYDPNVVDTAYTPNEGGIWVPGKIGLPRVVSSGGDIGPRLESNLVANGAAPATETFSVIDGNQYILSATGTYDYSVSGAFSGSLTGSNEHRSLAFTAAGTTLTITVNTAGTAWQLEDSTYSVNPTIPSAIIAAPGPAYRLANFFNPNTVDAGGVVVEGPHVPITDPTRPVLNSWEFSRDLTQKDNTFGGGSSIDDALTMTVEANQFAYVSQYDASRWPEVFTVTGRVRRISGSTEIGFRAYAGANAAQLSLSSPSGDRFRLLCNLPGTSTRVFVGLESRAAQGGNGQAFVAELTEINVNFEDVLGENIDTNESAVMKVYPYDNSNFSVDGNGVVTEKPVQPSQYYPVAELYTQRYPAATQLCTQPVDLTQVAWSKTNLTVEFDALGMDHLPNHGSTLTATSAGAQCLYTHSAPLGDFACALWVKRKSGTGVVEITVDNGLNWVPVTLDDTFRSFVASDNLSNPVFGISVKTAGDQIIVGAANLFAGSADAVRGLPPVFDTAPIAAAGGGNWAASVLGDPAKATLVTVELLPRFELDRAVQDILLSTAQNLLFGPPAGVNLQSNDGTNTSSVAIGQTTTDTPVFMGVFFGGEGLQVRINDSVGTLVPYNGNFSSGALSLLESLDASAGARGLLVTKGKDLAALDVAYDQLFEWFALELNSPLVTDESGNLLTDEAGAVITL